jgi:hypothetical protein
MMIPVKRMVAHPPANSLMRPNEPCGFSCVAQPIQSSSKLMTMKAFLRDGSLYMLIVGLFAYGKENHAAHQWCVWRSMEAV